MVRGGIPPPGRRSDSAVAQFEAHAAYTTCASVPTHRPHRSAKHARNSSAHSAASAFSSSVGGVSIG